MRSDGTPAERKLWHEFLKTLPAKFTRQKPLGPYIADFYCSSHRLIIEVDGDSHFSNRGEVYDAARTAWLASQGLRVVRFTNPEVTEEFEGVCERVLEALRKT
jgi:very-short-patch-repair endonuclease